MSQHDFSIANQTASNARSDINNALQALASTSSGTTAPSTTYANMLWYDTANNILKIRNEADSAWINVGYVDQGSSVFYPFVGSTQLTAFLDQDNMSSNSATAVASQQSIKAYVDTSVAAVQTIGDGQTWGDYRSSRSSGTKYRNTTGRAIQVIAGFKGDFGDAKVYVSEGTSDADYVIVYNSNGDGQPAASVGIIVPPNHYYYATWSSAELRAWAELR